MGKKDLVKQPTSADIERQKNNRAGMRVMIIYLGIAILFASGLVVKRIEKDEILASFGYKRRMNATDRLPIFPYLPLKLIEYGIVPITACFIADEWESNDKLQDENFRKNYIKENCEPLDKTDNQLVLTNRLKDFNKNIDTKHYR